MGAVVASGFTKQTLNLFLLCVLIIISCIHIPVSEARICRYKWEVKYVFKSPDCFRKLVIPINGRTPGATIVAEENDTIIVELKNSLLAENVAIHWHGIRQIGTPWLYGTEGVTQCSILPGQTLTYEFVVDRDLRATAMDLFVASGFTKQTLNLFLLCVLIIIFCINIPVAEARIQRYKWEVKYEFKSPDCFRKLAITINGRTPGPTIVAEQNDTIVVELKNSLLTENVAIHWHGIRQTGTPWFDGTEGVTQCPILPGQTFTYEFVVDRPGTYLYHAHYGMQREAGLYGSIRVSSVEPEPFTYDFDKTIILNDWYHKSTNEQATGLSAIPFQWVGEPQSLLLNGRGRYNCSLLTGTSTEVASLCNATNPECSRFALTVVPGKTYRLRISSLTTLSALSFQIEGHNMTVVEADGHYVEPFVVQNLFIYSGETYSVLIKTDQSPSRNYWATTNVVSRNATTPPGLAIINYYPNHPSRQPPTIPPPGPLWSDSAPRYNQSQAIKARQGFVIPPPLTADRTIVFLNTHNTVNGQYRWSVNNISLNLPHTPYLIALKNNLHHAFDQTPPPVGYDYKNYNIYNVSANKNATTSSGIYRLQFNSTVDIILQNANTMTENNSETHPWHFHGHDFWVLGYGEGKFDMYNDPKKYNLVNPIMKNTVPVHKYGWTALRFQADNPGAWAFHCHIESHFYMGMGVVFAEGIDRLGRLPSSIMGCVRH